MPRPVVFSIESSVSVAEIHSAFCSEDYWLARLAHFGGFGRLESLVVDPDGAVAVDVVHHLRHERLPRLVAKFFPRGWRVVQNEEWQPIEGGRVRGQVRITTYGAPGSGGGTAIMAPASNGSRMDSEGIVEFKVPLIGGHIETIMGRLLVQQFSVIQRFTTEWIAENA